LTVSSAHGAPSPSIGTNLYAWGAVVTCSAASVVEHGVDWQNYGWTGTGSVPASGATNTTGAILLTNLSSSITWKWNWQTALTITNSDNTIAITGYTGSGEAVDIPDAINGFPVTSIEAAAFQNCSSLTNVTIPASVTNIGAYAFDSCTNLIGITVDSANIFYRSTNGVLFNKSQTLLIQYPGGKTGSYTIPSSVTDIGAAAFSSCVRLSNITIPDSIVSIGNGVFFNCANLITATISGSVTNIGTRAFNACVNLEGVYFLGNAPSLGSNVFIGDSKATVYYLPDTTIWGTTFGGRPAVLLPYTYLITDGEVTITSYVGPGGAITIPSSINGLPVIRIGDWAFTDATGLTCIMIPGGITSIGDWAFAGCANLTGVYFQGNAPTLGFNVFNNNSATIYYMPETTGWTNPFGGRPTALWMPPISNNLLIIIR